MRRYHIVCFALMIALLSGCMSSREEMHLERTFEQNKNYHKRLMRTEKIQLDDGNFTKVTLTATYLNRYGRAKEGEEDSFLNYINPFEIFEQNRTKDIKQDERFIIGLYVEDDTTHEDDSDFSLTLNGKEPKKIEPITYDDPRLKDISFVSDWSQFYLVVFPHVESERFTMKFFSSQYGEGTLYFAKKAKYIYTKRAF